MSAPLTIDVVSDVVCPWCFLGKRRLEQAIASISDIAVAVRWRPFQLDPQVPREGLSREAYITGKFGDRSRFEAAEQRLSDMGHQEGAPYRFDLIKRTPNTIDAHRVVHWAHAAGQEAEAVERLFSLYFVEGADVGNHEVLAEAGASFGLDRATTLRRLGTDEDRDTVMADIAAAQRIGVTGVPCFILGGRYGVVGAQSAATLVQAIRSAAANLAKEPAA